MSFFHQYLEYVGDTEAPVIYHRWTCVSMLGALLGRQTWIPFGHGVIYPNQYIMLMGSPGTRKGTAMNIGRRLLKETGYTRFCPDRVSKERFLMEMKPYNQSEFEGELDLEHLVVDAPYEIYAFAEEFTDLVGQGGMEFMTMLTKLWDNMDKYEHPKIHGKSVVVEKPTVNMFGGNTVQGLALAIPPEALGNGFMSRVIFIHAEPTGKKISFPKPVDKIKKDFLLAKMLQISEEIKGEIVYSKESLPVLDRIYKEYFDVDDSRFRHYGTRRFTHLLKLCIIFAACRISHEISAEDAVNANTMLHYAEKRMPKALGEFGKSKYSETSNTVMEYLASVVAPKSMNEIWKIVAKDLSKPAELGDILKNLMHSEKIQVVTVGGKQGYMPKHVETKQWASELINENFLTQEELW